MTDNNKSVDANLIIKVNEEDDLAKHIAQIFNSTDPPNGIFIVNEIYVATALKIAKKRGLHVLDDVAIMGFTDGLISEFSSPQLTLLPNMVIPWAKNQWKFYWTN